MGRVTVACDGSSLGNPGPGGWAWVTDKTRLTNAGYGYGGPETTNNRMELVAVIEALQAFDDATPLRILCDSQYVINCVTVWPDKWRARGWQTAAGTPILNLDLIKTLLGFIEGRDVVFEWVQGHAGHPLNEEADRLARMCASYGKACKDSENSWGVTHG